MAGPSVSVELTAKMLAALTFERMLAMGARGKIAEVATPPGLRVWTLTDTKQRGLSVVVRRSSITFYVSARNGLKQLERAMAKYPDLSLDKARQRARSWAAMIADGKDPSEERRARVEVREAQKQRETYTFGVAFQEFVDMRAPNQLPGAKKDESHRDREKVATMLQGSKFWRTSMWDIDVTAVDGLMKPLKTLADGGAPPRGWGPKTGRSWSTVLKIWRHAQHAYRVMAQNHKIIASRDASPFALWLDAHPGFFPQQQPKDSHLNTTTSEGREWLMALWSLSCPTHDPAIVGGKVNITAGAVKPHHGVFVDYVLCLLLWGTRRAETASLRWTDVRFEEGVIILRPEETKARRAHGVPLTPWAVEVLRARERDNTMWRPKEQSPFVFPSRTRGKHIDGVPGLVDQLGADTGTRITAHDLRRTLATDMAMFTGEAERLGKILEIGVMLDHSKASMGRITPTTVGYIRRMADALRPLYQRRETYLRGLCGLLPLVEPPPAGIADDSALRAAIKADPSRAARLLAEVMSGA
jgi:integrase